MQRRKFVIGLGSLAAGTAAAMGTGAFSSVDADRSMTVNVVGDQAAYLKLEGQSPYASQGTDGTLDIDFGPNGQGGQGLNNNADSEFTDVFQIQNQGTKEVKVWIDLTEINNSLSSGYVTAWASDTSAGHIDAGLDQDTSGDWANSPEGIGIRLDPGEWVNVAIQFVNVSESVPTTISGTVPIRAAAEDSHVFDDVGFAGTTQVQ